MSTSEQLPANWLLGKWRSDRERTIQGWGDFPLGSVAFQSSVQRDLGKLTITYDGHASSTEFDGSSTLNQYSVVWQSHDAAFVVTGIGDEQSGNHIHFLSPAVYWVHTGRFVEYFCKVTDA
jgi:hypothetical protein